MENCKGDGSDFASDNFDSAYFYVLKKLHIFSDPFLASKFKTNFLGLLGCVSSLWPEAISFTDPTFRSGK